MANGNNGTGRSRGTGSPAVRPRSNWGASAAAKRDAGSLAEVPGLGSVLDRITAAGDGLIIARTSDGGAFALTLLDGASKPKRWPSNQEELDQAFADLSAIYDE